MNVERRFVDATEIEVEERSGSNPKIRGRAIVYNSPSRDLGGFREVIEPGAFDHIIARQRPAADVVALFNHDASALLARTSAGTLKLWSDDRGVMYEIDPLPKTQLAQDLVEHIRLRNVSGSSFAFTVAADGERYETDEDGNTTRYISRASGLFDVSPVTQPAYESSAVSVRSFEEYRAARQAPAAPAISAEAAARLRLAMAKARAVMARATVVMLAVLMLSSVAEARGRWRRSSSTYAAVPAGGNTSTAQGVAEICARMGRLQHMGGHPGMKEGLGMASTPEAAIRNCCFYGQMQILDQGVARGANGMYFGCIRGR